MLQPHRTACTTGLCKALPNTGYLPAGMCIPSPGQGHRAPFCQPVWQRMEMPDPWGQRAPQGLQPGCHCRTHPKAGFSMSAFRQGLLRKTRLCFPPRWPLRGVLGTQPPYSMPSLTLPIFWRAALTWTASSELPSKSCSSTTSTALIKAPRPPSSDTFWLFSSSLSLTLTLVHTSGDHSSSISLTD